jgi:hypothetical protein
LRSGTGADLRSVLVVGDVPHVGVQVRLVAFDSQDLAGAGFGEVGDMVTLTVQRVDRDHSVAQAADLVEQRRETGYLVGVVLYVSSNARYRSQRAPQPLGSFLCR